MKFGSRIDLFLPLSATIAVKAGDKVVGGRDDARHAGHVRRAPWREAGGSRVDARSRSTGGGIRRGVSLLPSLFTLANLFCGWACVVHAMRGELATAAPFIGVAVVLDMLDGRIARMTGTTSDFGVQLDSLADLDLVRHGAGGARVSVGTGSARPHGLGRRLPVLTGAALRLARFNIQTNTDKAYFIGLRVLPPRRLSPPRCSISRRDCKTSRGAGSAWCC